MITFKKYLKYLKYKFLQKSKPTKNIPKGLYCYEIKSINKSTGVIQTIRCPYYLPFKEGLNSCLYIGYLGKDPEFDDSCKICVGKEYE